MENNRKLTVANLITASGMVLAIMAQIKGWQGDILSFFWLFLAAAATDFFDGLAARIIEKHWPGWGVSEFGKKLDPIRDKVLFLCLLPLGLMTNVGYFAPASIIFLETIPVYFLSRGITRKTGKIVISEKSRKISVAQAFFGAALILSLYLHPEKFTGDFGAIFFLPLLVLSLGRVAVYFIDFIKLD